MPNGLFFYQLYTKRVVLQGYLVGLTMYYFKFDIESVL